MTDVVVKARAASARTSRRAPWSRRSAGAQGKKTNPDGTIQSPSNGLYRSDDRRARHVREGRRRRASRRRISSAASSSARPPAHSGPRLPLRDRPGRRRAQRRARVVVRRGGDHRSARLPLLATPCCERHLRVRRLRATWTLMADDNVIAKNPATGSALVCTGQALGYEPGRAGLVQPLDRAGPDAANADGDPDASRIRTRRGLAERARRPADDRAGNVQGDRPLFQRRDVHAARPRHARSARRTVRRRCRRRHTRISRRASGFRTDGGGVTLAVGNDGGFYKQHVGPARS